MRSFGCWVAFATLMIGCADGGTAGRDAGDATSMDAATPSVDAGVDAGSDAGAPELDAGTDAGPEPTAQICDGCTTHEECGPGMYCVELSGDGRACLPVCNPDIPDCPRRFNCVFDVGSGASETLCQPVGVPCCVDEDGDGYGRGVGCLGRDCDDAEEDVNPGTAERCNDVDDDCDGNVDETSGEVCDDGFDNDCDERIDCADDACDGAACGPDGLTCSGGACTCPGGGSESVCDDGTDSDCDGLTDCEDPDCEGVVCGVYGRTCNGGACTCPGGGSESLCADGVDNDCDGSTDCADNNCNVQPCGLYGLTCSGSACICPGGSAPESSCTDGSDNDCDGQVDCADADCDGASCDALGRTCAGGVCACPGGTTETSCGNGVDDDCDGATDCADANCAGAACDGSGRVCAAMTCTCPSSTELCNGVDDNCDGTADEGCPAGITLGSTGTASPNYGGSGGDYFDRPCAADEVLIGFDGREGSRIDRLQPICADAYLSTDTSSSPEHSYRVLWRNPRTLSSAGGSGGDAFSSRCPAGEVVIGILGASGSEVDSLGVRCGRIDLERDGGTWRAVATYTGNGTIGGGGGGADFSYTCPSGRPVGRRMDGRAGARIDRVRLHCYAVDVTLM